MGKIELLNCDCMEFMQDQPDKSFDLVITSPPYNLGDIHHTGGKRKKHYQDNLPEQEYQKQQINVLNELRRIIKPIGSLFYNHKNRIRNGLTISPLEWILKTKWTLKQEIVWRNGSQNFDKIRAYPMTERIYWLADSKVIMENNTGLSDCMLESNWPPMGTHHEHGRAFPLKMVTQILHCFPTTRKVFDPYLGFATTAIASYYFGVDFVGCEIDKDYYDAAVERFNRETAQIAMDI